MVSWFVSPICSAIIVFILFGLLRTFVLRSKHSFQRAFYVSLTTSMLALHTSSLQYIPAVPLTYQQA